MNAFLLAAGKGLRLRPYTENIPKGMIVVKNKTLIERQIDILNQANINDIIIIKGYKSEKINYPNVKYFHNDQYRETNMIESLMCAASEFNDDLIVTYADLIYTKELLVKLTNASYDISVCVDPEWRDYWIHRYGETETDLETLTIKNDHIVEIGSPAFSSIGINYRYIGIIKFSKSIINKMLKIYNNKKRGNENWTKSGNNFLNGYMTDLLDEMINNQIKINPLMAAKEWLEIDTVSDYNNLLKDIDSKKIRNYFSGDL